MPIYFIRHAQTQGNAKNIWVGRKNEPIVTLSCDHLKASSMELAGVDFDLIYCSPLLRARQTAEVIKQLQPRQPEIIIEAALQERDFGVFEGQLKTPERRAMLDCDPSVESIFSLQKRIAPVFARLHLQNKKILVVSHSAIYRCLIEHMGFKSTPEMKSLSNCGWVQLQPRCDF